MHPEELKEAIQNIKTWKRSGERAPHKPLLILYALGCLIRGESREMLYDDVKDDLKKLLMDFGPFRLSYSPNYPFVKLANDGIWTVSGSKTLDTKKDWSDRELAKNQAAGGFTEEVFCLLYNNQELLREVAGSLLKYNFPDTIQEDILAQVSIDLEFTGKTVRSPLFRQRVLKAYEYRCAVCGFNVRLGDTLKGCL